LRRRDTDQTDGGGDERTGPYHQVSAVSFTERRRRRSDEEEEGIEPIISPLCSCVRTTVLI